MRSNPLSPAVFGQALGHFTNDLSVNVLPILFPLLVPVLNLSLAQVGLVVTAYSLCFSLPQPLLGHLADRFGSRWLAPISVGLTVALISMAGIAPSYPVLIALVALAGLTSGTFHPQGARGAALGSGDRRSTGLSVFMVGGSLGYALGPVVAAAVFGQFGRQGTLALLPFGLLLAVVIFRLVSRQAQPSAARPRVAENRPASARYWLLAGVAAVTVVRAWIEMGLITYLPLLLAREGQDSSLASQVLFAFLISATLGVLLGGVASDRFGFRLTSLLSFLLLVPAVAAFLHTGSGASLWLAASVGFLYAFTMPVTLSLAQELAPSNMGAVSGAVMGVGQVAGGAGVSLIGLLGDTIGLREALNLLILVPLLAAAVPLTFPSRRHR